MLIRESTMAWNKMRKEILISAMLFFISSCLMVQADETTGNKIYVAETDPRYTGIGILCEYRLSEDGMIEEMLVYNYKHEPPTIEEAINSEEKNLIQRYYVKKEDNVLNLISHDYYNDKVTKALTIEIMTDDSVKITQHGKNGYTVKINIKDSPRLIYDVLSLNGEYIYHYESKPEEKIILYDDGRERKTYYSDNRPIKVVDHNNVGIYLCTFEELEEDLYKLDLYGESIEEINNFGTVYVKKMDVDYSYTASVINHFLIYENGHGWFLYSFFE